MKIKSTLLSLLLFSIRIFSQPTSWDFTNGTQGWTLVHSLGGYTGGGIYHLVVTGPDPYMYSPGSLNIDATAWGQLHVRLQNVTPATQFQVFWTTATDGAWNQAKSQFYTVNAFDSQQSDYTITLLGNINWTGTITQIRLDVGDNDIVGDSVLMEQVNFNPYEMGLDNGIVHVRLDMSQGGAISYISKSGSTRSIVNISDEGRYVQQSYYSGKSVNRKAQGQNTTWSPWPWNPIQVGDSYLHHAQMTDYSKGDTLYTACDPLQWDMDSMPAQATMEQWTTLDSNVITVRNRLTCFRTDTIYGDASDNQELPAVYIISALSNLYSYFGSEPFTNAPAQPVTVVNLSSGFWGVYDTTTEHWMAFVDDTLWGMGVYNARCTHFAAGLAGSPGAEANSTSTNYIAPTHVDTLPLVSVYEYTYNLIVGKLPQIRTAVYQLHADSTASVATSITRPQHGLVSIFPNPASNTVNIRLGSAQKATLELYNAEGRLLRNAQINTANYEMNIAGLAKGVYLIRLTGNEGVFSRKLVVE